MGNGVEKWSTAQKTGGLIIFWPNSPLALVSTHEARTPFALCANHRPGGPLREQTGRPAAGAVGQLTTTSPLALGLVPLNNADGLC